MQFQLFGNPAIITKEDDREAIHHGWVAEDPMRPGQLLLCVTNSYTFVRIPVGADSEHAKGAVPHDALKFAAENELPIKLTERHVMVGEDAAFRRPQDLKFPDLAAILPDDPKRPLRFALDSRLLSELTEAMGSERAELIFDLDKATEADGAVLYNSPVLVRRYAGDAKGQAAVPDGILMPVKVEGGPPPPAKPPEEAAPPAEPVPPSGV